MRVLVTGGSGFLGRQVVDRLRKMGIHAMAPVHSLYDLRNIMEVRQVFLHAAPDVVVHLAATVGGIGANQRNPGRFFYDNMKMGLNLIEVSRQTDTVKKVILIGTVCSYPKHAPVPFQEDSLWSGYPEETNAPYGIAKKALLTMAEAYKEQYGMDFSYLIPVNLYGPGDHFDPETSHVIPALIRKCVKAVDSGAEEIVVWGTGQATREFLYVEDCAEAIVRAVLDPPSNTAVNLGTGFEISIADLVSLIAAKCGFKGRIVYDPSRPDGQPRRSLNTELAKGIYGWEATTPLDVGLDKTIAWYKEHRE